MGSLILVFPGQASQYVGMGRDLYKESPAARKIMDDLSGSEKLSHIKRLCFEGPVELLTHTDNVQPAITVVSIMALEAIKEKIALLESDIAACAGHSLGEYAAHYAAGNLSLSQTLEFVQWRGYWMNNDAQPPNPVGAMVAVMGLDLDKLQDIVEECGIDRIAVANINSPGQVILSGLREDVEKASLLATARGAKKTVMLNVSGAWHSPLMRQAEINMTNMLEDRISSGNTHISGIPVVANATSEIVESAADLKTTLARQITSPVRWVDCVEKLVKIAGYPGLPSGLDQAARQESEPCPLFVEVGPGKVLKGLLRNIDRRLEVLNVEDMAGVELLKKKMREFNG